MEDEALQPQRRAQQQQQQQGKVEFDGAAHGSPGRHP